MTAPVVTQTSKHPPDYTSLALSLPQLRQQSIAALELELSVVKDELTRTASVASRVAASSAKAGKCCTPWTGHVSGISWTEIPIALITDHVCCFPTSQVPGGMCWSKCEVHPNSQCICHVSCSSIGRQGVIWGLEQSWTLRPGGSWD